MVLVVLLRVLYSHRARWQICLTKVGIKPTTFEMLTQMPCHMLLRSSMWYFEPLFLPYQSYLECNHCFYVSWCYVLRGKWCLWCYSEFISTLGKLRDMPDQGGNLTYELWNASPIIHLKIKLRETPQSSFSPKYTTPRRTKNHDHIKCIINLNLTQLRDHKWHEREWGKELC